MADGMGPTANAILLLGTVIGAVNWPMVQPFYEVLDLDPGQGSLRLRHRKTGNTYRLAVVQLSGTEFEPPTPGAPA